jgi:hypothetical protein
MVVGNGGKVRKNAFVSLCIFEREEILLIHITFYASAFMLPSPPMLAHLWFLQAMSPLIPFRLFVGRKIVCPSFVN